MSQQVSIALRSIITGRYYSLVSVAGLAIAITVVLLVRLKMYQFQLLLMVRLEKLAMFVRL